MSIERGQKLIAAAQSVDTGRWSCSFEDITSIWDASGGGAVETGANCFFYGFLKGQQAAKAAFERQRREALEVQR